MKKFLVIAMGIIFSGATMAQSEKYAGAMKKNIDELEGAMQKGAMPDLANNFERIAEAEKTQWLPYYYASYCTVMNAYTMLEKEADKIDGVADKADQLIKKAEELAGGENSETCVIKSMIASARMMVDPQSRWQQWGQVSTVNIVKAKSMDPANPRPVYLEGQAKFYTPEAFGGGKQPAKQLFEQALGMFDKFKPATDLHPSWGKSATNYFLAQCN